MTPSRRTLLLSVLAVACAPDGAAATGYSAPNAGRAYETSPWRALTEAQWRERLSPAAFAVLRQENTERPGASPLNAEKRKGVFACAGCGLPLFRSVDKYESGTGWPSFRRVIKGAVETKPDVLLFTPRTEYHCARCLGHQGHVFEDGPPPTGLRFCNNGTALTFLPA